MKIVIFGGTFNPPHRGHEHVIRLAAGALHPDRILVIPANIPPLKQMESGSPTPRQRLAMCRRAFRRIPGVTIDDRELRREGESYTVDTLRGLREEYPQDELFFVLGSDQLLRFRSWHRFEEILALCSIVAVPRVQNELLPLEKEAEALRKEYSASVRVLDAEPLPVSSTDIRRGVSAELLCPAVRRYIRLRRLYRKA